MQSEVILKPKATVELKITVDAAKVKATYDHALADFAAEVEIKGFRKGQAPMELVLEKLDKAKLYTHVVEDLVKNAYPQAIKEHNLQPVSMPRVKLNDKGFDLDHDFDFTITFAVRPEVKVGDYHAKVTQKYAQNQKQHKAQNAERLKKGEPLLDSQAVLTSQDVIDVILENTDIALSDLLIEDEVAEMMGRLINQAQAVGISLEQYLKSQNKTAEQLKTEYAAIASRLLAAEFALDHLVQKENVTVTDQELDALIAAADSKTKTTPPNHNHTTNHTHQTDAEKALHRKYLRTILQKNKLISQIIKASESGPADLQADTPQKLTSQPAPTTDQPKVHKVKSERKA